MRRVLSLLLTVAMMLSLVVVAGAAESGKVDLVIEPKATDTANVVQFDVKLVPQNVTEIGAFQFTLTAQNCTIDKVVYLNNGNDGEDGGGGLQFYKDKVGAENFVNGYFEKFGGEITSNKTVYKFLAAGTARSEYTYGGVTYPAHIWRNPTETLILTLQVTMNDGAKNCSLAVDTAGSSGRFTVGQSVDVGNGKYEVKDACTGAVTSNKYGADDVLWGDIDGNGKVNLRDVAYLNRYLAKWDAYTTLPNPAAADVDGNGKVNLRDVAYLNRYLAKWEGYPALG